MKRFLKFGSVVLATTMGLPMVAQGAWAQIQTQEQLTNNSALAGSSNAIGDGTLNPTSTINQNFEGSEPTDRLETVPNVVAPGLSPSTGSPNAMTTYFNGQFPCFTADGSVVLLNLQMSASTPQEIDTDGTSGGGSILGFGLTFGDINSNTEITPAMLQTHADQLQDAQRYAGIVRAQCAVAANPASAYSNAISQVLTEQALEEAGIYESVMELLANDELVYQQGRRLGHHVSQQLNHLILVNQGNDEVVAEMRADLNLVTGNLINLSRSSQGELSVQGLQIDASTEYASIESIHDKYVGLGLMQRHLIALQ